MVVYQRSGGLRPLDDELLDVWRSGRLLAIRTVAGPRVGLFGGALGAPELAELARAVDACRGAEPVSLPVPRDAAAERVFLHDIEGSPRVSLGGGEDPGPPWAALVAGLRSLLDSATEQPWATLELRHEDGVINLVRIGEGLDDLALDRSTLALELVWLGPDGVPRRRRQAAPVGTPGGWVSTPPGWSERIGEIGEPGPAPGEWLQVWLTGRFRLVDVGRTGRWFLAVQGGS